MKFNLIGSTAHLNISSGNAAHYIKRLDIPVLVALKKNHFLTSTHFELCNKIRSRLIFWYVETQDRNLCLKCTRVCILYEVCQTTRNDVLTETNDM